MAQASVPARLGAAFVFRGRELTQQLRSGGPRLEHVKNRSGTRAKGGAAFFFLLPKAEVSASGLCLLPGRQNDETGMPRDLALGACKSEEEAAALGGQRLSKEAAWDGPRLLRLVLTIRCTTDRAD